MERNEYYQLFRVTDSGNLSEIQIQGDLATVETETRKHKSIVNKLYEIGMTNYRGLDKTSQAIIDCTPKHIENLTIGLVIEETKS